MARKKRKAAVKTDSPPPTQDKRQKKSVEATAPSIRSTRSSLAAASAPRSTRSSLTAPSSATKGGSAVTKKPAEAKSSKQITSDKKAVSKPKSTKAPKKTVESASKEGDQASRKTQISIDVPQRTKPPSSPKKESDLEEDEHDVGPSYWLMKAEPDSRIEKGKDVKFSIDDLKAATEPEGWDGVRNFVARNNMRLMMKGDLAFFYHSNCRVPGIVGTMEIVREHSIDETAFDAEHPYFDAKSDREKPKWCLVHVEFRQKFPEIVKLKELQRYAKDGGILEHMQVLNQSRLSVSKVTKKEWDFIMGLVDVDDAAVAPSGGQP